jgi:hypothetical protein
MRVYVSLDSREFVASPVLLQRVNTLFFVRRDNVPVEVQFVRGGTVVELGSGATGRMGVKATYDGDLLAFDSNWTKSGAGATTIYTLDLNFNTTELDALFPEDDEDSVTAKVELEWTVGATVSSTLPCAAVIFNDVLRGGEVVPTVVAETSFLLESPDSSVWQISIDNDGALTAIKQ